MSVFGCYLPGSTKNTPVAVPIFNPAAGSYAGAQTVTIGTATAGASIRYTMDGIAPTGTSGTLYSTPLNVTFSQTIMAIAYEAGWADSAVATAAYTIGKTVSTLAGSYAGAVNGPGATATFTGVEGVAVDSAGNVYVADQGNDLIRFITPAAVVSTFAGSVGVQGSVNATGTSASFKFPEGVAVDSAGNVYVADTWNNMIRKITPSGVVSTLAGSLAGGSVNATGTLASFNLPSGVAVDSAGNVYVADTDNNLIRMITPGGVVTTLAGSGAAGSDNGTGAAASFKRPQGIAVDSAGNVYVGDTGNNLVRKITPSGVVSTLAGSGAAGAVNGTGTGASFNYPVGVAVDASGNVYVGDNLNNLIREISPAGAVSTLAGSGAGGTDDGPAASATFSNPAGVAVDSLGNVYVADSGDNKVRMIH